MASVVWIINIKINRNSPSFNDFLNV